MTMTSRAAHSPLWDQLGSRDATQVATALSGLVSGRHTPAGAQQARALVELLREHSGSAAISAPALVLLARWARAAGVAVHDADAQAVLQGAVQLALGLVSAGGLQQEAGPAAARFLGSAAEGCPGEQRLQIAEVLGQALLDLTLQPDPAALGVLPVSADVIGGVTSLLPALMGTPPAACWVLAALLSACQVSAVAAAAASSAPGHLAAVDNLAPLYPMMRSVAASALARARPEQAVPLFLQPLAAVLASGILQLPVIALELPESPPAGHPGPQLTANSGCGGRASGSVGGTSEPAQQGPAQPSPAQAAACALCLGGLLEGLLRSAPGFAPCQALAQEAERLLLRACDAAAAAAALEAGGAAEGRLLEGWSEETLLRDCCSLATLQAFQGCRRPAPTPSILRCQTATLLRSALSLEPLFSLAAAQAPPAAANEALSRQLASAPCQRAGELAASVAQHAAAAAPAERWWVVGEVGAAAQRAFRGYQSYTTQVPLDWLGQVNAHAVKAVLDRLFMSATVVLSSLWAAAAASSAQQAQHAGPAAAAAGAAGQPGQAPPAPSRTAAPGSQGGPAGAPTPAAPSAAAAASQLAAPLVAAFADLQFCRLALPAYAALLKEALAAVAEDAGAAQALAACLPCYADLAAACAARGGAPLWLVDSVAASKVQFLMSVLAPCCRLLPQATLEQRLAPAALLYLLHPHPPAAAAAHQLLAALLPPLPPPQRERLGPFYIDRALEGYPGPTAVEPLQAGLASLLRALPPGSPVPLYCLGRLLAKCGGLEAADRVEQGEALPRLFSVAAGLLLAVDFAIFRPALAVVGDHIEAAPPAQAPRLLLAAFDVVSHSDDCVRKPALVAWYQRLAERVAQQRREGAAAGAAAQRRGRGGGAAAVGAAPP